MEPIEIMMNDVTVDEFIESVKNNTPVKSSFCLFDIDRFENPGSKCRDMSTHAEGEEIVIIHNGRLSKHPRTDAGCVLQTKTIRPCYYDAFVLSAEGFCSKEHCEFVYNEGEQRGSGYYFRHSYYVNIQETETETAAAAAAARSAARTGSARSHYPSRNLIHAN